jgi:hypothetical protein
MKINWGTYIIIAFVVFISFIIYIVSGSMNTKIDLVTKDYYKKELNYQEDINRQKNASNLSSSIKFEIISDQFIIQLPEELATNECTASIYFYRPSDKVLDKHFEHTTQNGLITVNNSFLTKGKWRLIVNVNTEDTNYQFIEELYL